MKKMKKNTKYLFALLGVLLFLGSCASKKDMVYFQGVDEVNLDSVNGDYSPVLLPDDQLSIVVSSLDMKAAIPFNLPVVSVDVTGTIAAGGVVLQTYLIASDGTIEFPQLGTLKLAGLTRLEAVLFLKEKLRPFLLDPVVNMQLVNFKVTVLGEVKRPGKISVKNERITIVEALGSVGDATLWGKRENVLVIRETEQGKTYTRIDLTSEKMFQSPVYYLQQNDVVYVEPNKPRINNSATSSTTSIIISVTSLVITVLALFVN